MSAGDDFAEDMFALALPVLNQAFASLPVSPDYEVAFYCNKRAYLFTSPMGRLRCEKVDPSRITPKIGNWCRVTMDAEAMVRLELSNFDDTVLEKMEAFGKVHAIGNPAHLELFKKELKPHQTRLNSVIVGAIGKEAESERLEACRLFLREEEEYYEWANSPDKKLRPAEPETAADGERPYPMEDAIQRWVLFSAMSTMGGNIGQSNYTSANAYLDQLSRHKRNQEYSWDTTLMWGAVAGIGMRWKAFASQDMLAATALDTLFTVREAAHVLHCVAVFQSPEWVGCQLGWYNPWSGNSQGGGYIDAGAFECSIKQELTDIHESQPVLPPDVSLDKNNYNTQEVGTTPNAELACGQTVRLIGWTMRKELNGITGELVRQMKDGKWRVRLSDGRGEKVISNDRFEVLTHSVGRDNLECTEASEAVEDQLTTSVLELHSEGQQIRGNIDLKDAFILTTTDIDKIHKEPSVAIFFRAAHPELQHCEMFTVRDSLVRLLDTVPWRVMIIRGAGNELKRFAEMCFDNMQLHALHQAAEEWPPYVESKSQALIDFLQTSRPDWTRRQINAVYGKLACIRVKSVPDLLFYLRDANNNGINDMLMVAGEKCFTKETLEQFRQCAEHMTGPLAAFLHAARPHWTTCDVFTVRIKLLHLQIGTLQDLFAHWYHHGSHNLSEVLHVDTDKSAVWDTLYALRRYADQLVSVCG